MNIGFYDAYKINNELYFSSCSFNGLFKLNLLSGEVIQLGTFKDELLVEPYLHGSTIGYDGRIYFIPFNAKGISMYDIESDRFLFQQMAKCRYGVPMEYQENIIIVPSNLKDNILSLNKEKKEFEVNRVLSDKVHQLVKDIGVATCDLNGSLILENQLYIGVFGENIILKINLINYKTERIFVNGISIGNMIIFNNSIWIVSDLGKTVWCISKRGEIASEYKVGKEEPIRNFQCFCEFNNELYLLGCEEDNMLKYINGKWESIISKFPPEFQRITDWSFFCRTRIYDNKLYLFPCSGNGIIILNSDDTIQFIEVKCQDIDHEKIKQLKRDDVGLLIKEGIIVEGTARIKLEDYISFLTERGENNEKGNSIWNGCIF